MLAERSLVETLLINRRLIWRLAVNSVRERYASSLLDSVWAVLHPAMMLVVFWFVFEFGLRISSAGPVPFFLSLIVGLAAWLFFSDAVLGGINAVVSNSYVIKKIAFPLEILPVIPVIAALIVHVFILIAALAIMAVNGYYPGPKGLLLLPYYLICAVLLATGLSYLLSALNVFHSDIGQTAGLLVQLWFWLTPIVWTPEHFPPDVRPLLEYNPMFYIVTGYRDALLLTTPVQTMEAGVKFWTITTAILTTGLFLFRRLKYDFADVL